MALLIDSSPDCVTNTEGAKPADDIADFILQANYEDCAGFMTFGPGSTYGEEGAAAAGAYYFLVWFGAAVVVLAFVAWFMFENRRLMLYAARNALGATETRRPSPAGPGPGSER